MKYLLDTDHVSVLFFESGAAFDSICLKMASHSWFDVGVSIISLHEQFLGCHSFLNRQRRPLKIVEGYGRLLKVFRLYSSANVVAYDSAAAATFDNLSSQRLRMTTMDLRIASVAVAAGLTLVTRNRSDFSQVTGLAIEDWTI